MNCPECGKFMEKVENLEECCIEWHCPDYWDIVIKDYVAFEKVWDEIDKQNKIGKYRE